MQQYLADLIKISGPISVANFMNEALFNPKFGYYNQKNPFGINGDFTTSPEISQVFGELIGAYFVHLWQNNYHQQKINLLEIGAGQGTLMKDLLISTNKIENFTKQTSYHIIEISPKLQALQKKNLQNFSISWWENFSDFYNSNKEQPLFFIANELFDCFAINQFVKTKSGWAEKLITIDEKNNLHFTLSDYNPVVDKIVRDLVNEDAPENAIFEYSPKAANLMDELSLNIKKSGGVGIIIDYGYSKNQFQNSLQAVKNHQFCHPLENAGNCDITALVNFNQLEIIAKKNGLNTSLITQKNFLESLGIETRREKLILNKTLKQQEEINSAINRLIDKKQMGELFKCLIFW